MPTTNFELASIKSLNDWVKLQDYYGWDIYDGLNSPVTGTIKNPYVRIFLIQMNKYSPINFRNFLKIRKEKDLKGITLFSQAYANLSTLTNKQEYMNDLLYTLSIVRQRSLASKYGRDCWASHSFPYVSIDKSILSSTIPDIIGTSNAIIALVKGYTLLKDPVLKDMAISASHFLMENLFDDLGKFPFFRYSTQESSKSSITLNASSQALEALSYLFPVYPDEKMINTCNKVCSFLMEQQKTNGSWDYSLYTDGRTKRVQLDFHQGYMIDGLLAFLPYASNKDDLISCIENGSAYYRNTLFRNNGTSYYRYPIPFPVDIHNQAQGIITFSKMGKINKEYLDFAKKIGKWTINHMQDINGFFYYQKWPVIVNEIPHMRWGQAWMMLAISQLIQCEKVSDD
jgi:hypothetical protein